MRGRRLGALAGVLAVMAYVRPASAQDWWDSAWPYRIEVTVTGTGVAEANIDFGATLTALGLNRAILDVRSLRVVPYDGETPGTPLPHAETYSVVLDSADEPQVEWSDSGTYFTINDGELVADATRFSEGTGSVRAVIQNRAGGYGYPGVELHVADGGPSDWSAFDALIYDVWPEVNASALDQAPDLYYFKLYDTGCESSDVTQGGPALALDQWNRVSVPLNPLDTCAAPDLSNITRAEFHTRDNDTVDGNSGVYDDGDDVTLWLDDLRLVDQDAGGVRWEADGTATSYFVYFDVLEHEGHPEPTLADLEAATLVGTPGTAEAGGYYHRASGAAGTGLALWGAPSIEKITREHTVPTSSAPLRIQAARNEFEPLQLVVNAASAQSLPVSISDLVSADGTITASNVAIHRVDYVPMTRPSDRFGRLGDWPDPLYPIAPGASVTFPADQNQPLWFTVYVPTDAAAGTYEATITIGTTTVPVTLDVWDFALPPEIHLTGEWGFGWSEIVETYRGTVDGSVQDCYWDLVDALYEDFAGHRLVPKGVGWPAGLNYPGGVEYDCNGGLDPDAWGDWGFATLADRYLDGNSLANVHGFPTFLFEGPASNWPPDSRPSDFCAEGRGTDPPGNTNYNMKWFQYLAAVSGYLESSGYAGRGYYHIVNEPQTEEDYDIVAYLAQQTKASAPNIDILVSEQVEPLIYDNPTYPDAKIDIWVPTITNYEAERAHDRQQNHDEQVWWYFLYGDRPPLPNPTVVDRTGLEARIIPWLAWAERVDGLLYYSTTAWDPSPWDDLWLYDGNGDGFMLYPPKDSTIAFDACDPRSNRLVPSIRWELLREGMEDYEYLWVLNGGDPDIAVSTAADALVAEVVSSRTLFSRVPTDVYATRAEIAGQITGEVCADECTEGSACEGDMLVVCAPNVAGCLQETRSDCAAAPDGRCDATSGECVVDEPGTGGTVGAGAGGTPGGGMGGAVSDGGTAVGGTGENAGGGAGGTPGGSTGGGADNAAGDTSGGGSAGTAVGAAGDRGSGGGATVAGAPAVGGRGAAAESGGPASSRSSDDHGCGCRTADSRPTGGISWSLAFALALVVRRRRR